MDVKAERELGKKIIKMIDRKMNYSKMDREGLKKQFLTLFKTQQKSREAELKKKLKLKFGFKEEKIWIDKVFNQPKK